MDKDEIVQYLENEIKCRNRQLSYPKSVLRIITTLFENGRTLSELVEELGILVDYYIQQGQFDIAEDFLIVNEIITNMNKFNFRRGEEVKVLADLKWMESK